MKFVYEYRTSDNVSHRSEINAADRDAAFSLLKSRGIKPSRLVPAPGLLNWVVGLGKRWLAIALLIVIALTLLLQYCETSRLLKNSQIFLDDVTRRQVIGDSAVVEKGIRTGWADVFSDEGERFLASFAVPGVPAGLRAVAESKLKDSLSRRIVPSENDSIEARQIKAMVEGMKDELREFLSAGGTVREYGDRLVQRQEEELGYYNRFKTELETAEASDAPEAELMSLWEYRNAELRGMGIRTISYPRTQNNDKAEKVIKQP